MQEFSILCIINKGCPFINGRIYKNYFEAYEHLLTLKDSYENSHFLCYVDNQFFKNSHCKESCEVFLQLQVRNVSSWNSYNF